MRVELGRWLSAQADSTNLPAGSTSGEVVAYQAALDSTILTDQQHLGELGRLDAARKAQFELEASLRSGTGFSEPPPYSVLRVDSLRNSIQSLKTKIEAGQTTRRVLESFVAQGEAALKQSDERMRRLAEELETSQDKARLPPLNWQRALEKVRRDLAEAQASLNSTRQLRLQTELTEQQQRLTSLQRQLASCEGHITFSASDFAAVTQSLDREIQTLDAERISATQERARRQEELDATRAELNQALQQFSTPGGKSTDGQARVESLRLQAELRSSEAETAAQRLNVTLQLQELLGNEKALWQARYLAYATDDLSKLQQAFKGADRLRSSLKSARPHFQEQVEVAAALSAEQNDRLRQTSLPQDVIEQARQLLANFQTREEWARRALRGMDRLERLTERWREELDQQRNAMPMGDRVRDLFSSFSGLIGRLWNFELLTVQDTVTVDGQSITGQRRVTLGKIGSAILILLVGCWMVMLMGRLFESLAVRRLKMEPNQASLMRRWVRIFLVMALVVFSLVLVKIPLTVFAFMGGALAIGVGFGTQNLLKNFISGIIILFERTFRVGDVLDIADRRGSITNIGIRSSVLQLWDGTEVVIPNSTMLENNVINWTYSNKVVRFSVEVGVAYDSDTRQVIKLLSVVAHEHGLVQKEPKPQVLLQQFGDSALIFELRYWVDVLGTNAAQVASDLRLMIAGNFTEHGIIISFPQRDVHLNAARPLPVQIVNPTGAKS